jgi:polyhydroxybutyrate depolymerase
MFMLFFLCFPISVALAQNTSTKTIEWNIDGTIRKAIVYVPASAKSKATPVIFAFHGHGGTMQGAFKSRRFDQLWTEAIFVCPQGLNTRGMLTDPEGKKSGWVMDDLSDSNRDLQFFDAMLKSLRADYQIDNSRIYATGHSNGGGFTYLLLATRANEFAAFAATATAAGKLIPKLSPKPVLHLTGQNDPLVKPFMQKNTHNAILKLNQCNNNGIKLDTNATLFKGKNGNDVVIFLHQGGHQYPKFANQPIIDFLKKYRREED